MRCASEERLEDGVLERSFTVGGVPGVLWTRGPAPAALVLVGHPGGSHKRLPRLVARARHYAVAHGFAVAALDAPGCGERPRDAGADRVRAEVRRAARAGEPVDALLEALVAPLVQQAVPEWRAALDALRELPGLGGPVAYDGFLPTGLGLALAEPRLAAAVWFGMSHVPDALREQARSLTLPVQLLVQWDDGGSDRQRALDLFDAVGSREKTLHANAGGHTATPWFEVEDAGRFLARHLV